MSSFLVSLDFWLPATPWLTLLAVMALLVMLVWGRVAPEVLFVVWAVGFHVLGWVDQATLLGGSVNPVLVTLVLLLLVSVALERSGLVRGVVRHLVRRGEETTSVLRLSTLAVALSAFVNNTAVVGSLGTSAQPTPDRVA